MRLRENLCALYNAIRHIQLFSLQANKKYVGPFANGMTTIMQITGAKEFNYIQCTCALWIVVPRTFWVGNIINLLVPWFNVAFSISIHYQIPILHLNDLCRGDTLAIYIINHKWTSFGVAAAHWLKVQNKCSSTYLWEHETSLFSKPSTKSPITFCLFSLKQPGLEILEKSKQLSWLNILLHDLEIYSKEKILFIRINSNAFYVNSRVPVSHLH